MKRAAWYNEIAKARQTFPPKRFVSFPLRMLLEVEAFGIVKGDDFHHGGEKGRFHAASFSYFCEVPANVIQ